MPVSSIPLAQTVMQLCELHKIQHIVVSPGSRNAPLTISFTQNNYFTCYSIVDERCAAFFALGIAQQLQQPVAVICTSGSALLNYFPAVSEAFYSTIPLVILSADRPKCLVGIGDGQTINQTNVYDTHVAYSANLKLDYYNNKSIVDDDAILHKQEKVQQYNETEIDVALRLAKQKSQPVHINIPFNEPLYTTLNTETIALNPKNKAYLATDKVSQPSYTSVLNALQISKRIMILVGVLQPNSIEQRYVDALASRGNVLILTETTSNVHHKNICSSIDQLIGALTEAEFKTLQPDVLLTFGGLIVSKKIKAFLRNFQPKNHWHVGKHNANDTFFCLTGHFKLLANTFLDEIFKQPLQPTPSSYLNHWLDKRNTQRSGHKSYLKTIPFTDFKVFKHLLNAIPSHTQLQVGNSSAIRYTQLFQLNPTITVFCNRGTSGIDGSTSTAIGAAVAQQRPVTFITGDLSFFYDSNALWNNYIPNDFRIIVVNNSGGGIFRILPGHKNTENFDTYFETKHQLTATHLCKMYGLNYFRATNETELSEVLNIFYNVSKKPQLLEVFTPSGLNDEVLLNYFNAIN